MAVYVLPGMDSTSSFEIHYLITLLQIWRLGFALVMTSGLDTMELLIESFINTPRRNACLTYEKVNGFPENY